MPQIRQKRKYNYYKVTNTTQNAIVAVDFKTVMNNILDNNFGVPHADRSSDT